MTTHEGPGVSGQDDTTPRMFASLPEGPEVDPGRYTELLDSCPGPYEGFQRHGGRFPDSTNLGPHPLLLNEAGDGHVPGMPYGEPLTSIDFGAPGALAALLRKWRPEGSGEPLTTFGPDLDTAPPVADRLRDEALGLGYSPDDPGTADAFREHVGQTPVETNKYESGEQ